MDHNPNTQNGNQHNQKGNLPNSRSRFDNNKRPDRNRRYGQDKNPNAEGNRVVKAQLGNKDKSSNQDRQKGRDDVKHSAKPRENKSVDKISHEAKHADKAQLKKTYKSNQSNSSGSYSRYGRNGSRNTGHSEIFGRHINTKHIETVEDIKADIERIDKDIQFEIKQIKAVKLGL